ncbi:MAG: hypothetical protein IJ588_09300 [Prevotella sp.]|nr:hypothetical protein [Prevotella sp.]
MKRLFFLLAFMAGLFTAHADNYAYLTFETTSGEKVSVEASSLTITFSGTTLNAGSQSFALSNLKKMYFSSADETTDLKALTVADWSDVTEIYDLNGRKVSKDGLRKGIYVVKSKKGTYKIAVK